MFGLRSREKPGTAGQEKGAYSRGALQFLLHSFLTLSPLPHPGLHQLLRLNQHSCLLIDHPASIYFPNCCQVIFWNSVIVKSLLGRTFCSPPLPTEWTSASQPVRSERPQCHLISAASPRLQVVFHTILRTHPPGHSSSHPGWVNLCVRWASPAHGAPFSGKGRHMGAYSPCEQGAVTEEWINASAAPCSTLCPHGRPSFLGALLWLGCSSLITGILCPILVSRDCVCLLTKRWTPQDRDLPSFLCTCSAQHWSTPVSPSWTHQLWGGQVYVCSGRRSRENRDSVAADLFQSRNLQWVLEVSFLCSSGKSQYSVSLPWLEETPTLGGSSFKATFFLLWSNFSSFRAQVPAWHCRSK